MALSITGQDGAEVIKVRVPESGKKVKEINAVMQKRGFFGSLEADGFTLTDSDIVSPTETVTYVPGTTSNGDSSALPFIVTPVAVPASKKQKIAALQSVTRRASVSELVGTADLDVLAALNWLGLHLSEEASIDLSTFLGTTHEKRYYPYVLAVLRAAAASSQGRVEVVGEDKNKNHVPDVQVVIDGGRERIPMDVEKVSWGHGSVDDPDGISRNMDNLDQLLRYVLNYNARKTESYSCLTAVTIRVQHVIFLRFRIRKTSAQDLGTLELLEYAPAFPRRGAGHSTTEVRMINMENLINSKFGLKKEVETMKLPDALFKRIQSTTFQELLPAAPPEGFEALIKYFRTVAPSCYDPLEFMYDSREGQVRVAQVLASGPKSCVVATVGGSSVLKVSSKCYIDLELNAHGLADQDCPFLRKMVAFGHVKGAAPGLMFIELEGLGVSWSSKHVLTEAGLHKCWEEASTAIKALHAKRVFHRDIKPSNFIVFDHGMESQRLVLHDLDCAAGWDMSMSSNVGTPMFQSPLMADDDDYCCRDDWLSLGLSFANLMKLDSQTSNQQGKLNVLNQLLTCTLVPEDMKNTIRLALLSRHVCCHRLVTCAVAEYYGDTLVLQGCDGL